MRKLRLAVIGAIAVCATALASGHASAMPVGGVASAASEMATDVQNVRWVCGPFRCWWRPNYYPYYGAYAFGPRFHARPWWGGHHHARPWGGRRW
jgi:hypothetical protein